MPLAEVIKGMPNYGKFLKDLTSSKGKYQEVSATFLNEACSAILQKPKMPPKLGDPDSFIIPHLLGDSIVYDALADLGESVNLMPYSLYLKLGLGDLKPTRMGIRLPNHSFDTPIAMSNNVFFDEDVPTPCDYWIPILLNHPMRNVFTEFEHASERQLLLMRDTMTYHPSVDDTPDSFSFLVT
ncbi:uncharacterized protein [Rutidosis leptorrhynchoides]|uniref:uncharacterized protein n=1 Tax=Rutidosis leptorrhynchoides TaxID=125765 RepID=UPI003A98F369